MKEVEIKEPKKEKECHDEGPKEGVEVRIY